MDKRKARKKEGREGGREEDRFIPQDHIVKSGRAEAALKL